MAKKNPTDPLRLAREVVEAAIGEPLYPRRKTKKRKSERLKRKS